MGALGHGAEQGGLHRKGPLEDAIDPLSETAIESVHALFDSSRRLLYGPQRFEALEL